MNSEELLYKCKEARHYVLELMTFINPYAGSPSDVFRILTAFDKVMEDIEKEAVTDAFLKSVELEQ